MARKLRYNLNFFPHFHPPFRCWVGFELQPSILEAVHIRIFGEQNILGLNNYDFWFNIVQNKFLRQPCLLANIIYPMKTFGWMSHDEIAYIC